MNTEKSLLELFSMIKEAEPEMQKGKELVLVIEGAKCKRNMKASKKPKAKNSMKP